MITENYACAYKEVIEILKYTRKEDVNKIPKDEVMETSLFINDLYLKNNK